MSQQSANLPVPESSLCHAPGKQTLGQHGLRQLLVKDGGTIAGIQQFTHLLQKFRGLLTPMQKKLLPFCVAEFQCLKKDGLKLFRV